METGAPSNAVLSPSPPGWSPDGTWFWDGRQQGRWLAAMIIGGTWFVGVLLILTVHPQ